MPKGEIAMKGRGELGSRQSRGKSGFAACCAESLWLSGQTASLLPLGSAGRLSLPADPRGLVRAEALGKAKPFRTAGGTAALGCYLSGTLTRPCRGSQWSVEETPRGRKSIE